MAAFNSETWISFKNCLAIGLLGSQTSGKTFLVHCLANSPSAQGKLITNRDLSFRKTDENHSRFWNVQHSQSGRVSKDPCKPLQRLWKYSTPKNSPVLLMEYRFLVLLVIHPNLEQIYRPQIMFHEAHIFPSKPTASFRALSHSHSIPIVSLSGRSQNFRSKWKQMTNDAQTNQESGIPDLVWNSQLVAKKICIPEYLYPLGQ